MTSAMPDRRIFGPLKAEERYYEPLVPENKVYLCTGPIGHLVVVEEVYCSNRCVETYLWFEMHTHGGDFPMESKPFPAVVDSGCLRAAPNVCAYCGEGMLMATRPYEAAQ